MQRSYEIIFFPFFFSILLGACTTAPLETSKLVYEVDAQTSGNFATERLELDRAALAALEKFWLERQNISRTLSLGEREFPGAAYVLAASEILQALPEAEPGKTAPDFSAEFWARFEWAEVKRSDAAPLTIRDFPWPRIRMQTRKDSRATLPLRAAPPEVIHVDLAAYRERFPRLVGLGASSVYDSEVYPPYLFGRLAKNNGSASGPRAIQAWTSLLEGRPLGIWLEPNDWALAFYARGADLEGINGDPLGVAVVEMDMARGLGVELPLGIAPWLAPEAPAEAKTAAVFFRWERESSLRKSALGVPVVLGAALDLGAIPLPRGVPLLVGDATAANFALGVERRIEPGVDVRRIVPAPARGLASLRMGDRRGQATRLGWLIPRREWLESRRDLLTTMLESSRKSD